MSLKTIPGLGKPGMSRTSARRVAATGALASASANDPAQIADEEQVLEVRRHRGEVLERLDRLLAALGVARAQRRGEDLLQQRRLAVGRRAERAQVAPADAVARKLGHGAHDLALGLVVDPAAVAQLALDDAVILELAHQPRVGARLVDDLLEREQLPGRRRGDARLALAARALAPGRRHVLVGTPGRELLA